MSCLAFCTLLAVAPCNAEEPPLVVFMPPSTEELAAVTEPALRERLLRLASDDQRVRQIGGCGETDPDPDGTAARMAEIDRRNTAELKAIVDAHGWPTAALAGADGARAAWLLAQHADHDLAWQRRCLELMEPHTATGDVDPIDFAYLTDRVRVNQGLPQLYGTQFELVGDRRSPRPIENPETVDERRKALGMRSLESYTKFANT